MSTVAAVEQPVVVAVASEQTIVQEVRQGTIQRGSGEDTQLQQLRAQIEKVDHNTSPSVRPPVRENVLHLCTCPSWTPPQLLPLRNQEAFTSPGCWMGEVDRFELVKSGQRTVNRQGQELSDAELEYCVCRHEIGEDHLVEEQFAEAVVVFEDVVHRFPNSTLAYYKLGVAKLALIEVGAAMNDTELLFQKAVLIEPENNILRVNVDLILRMCSDTAIPDSYWTEQFPKSRGIIQAALAYKQKQQI
jgi:hypothetical protein